MAIPPDCWRIVYRGSLPHGEQWQSGYWLNGNAPTSNVTATAAAELEMESEGGTSESSLWNVFKDFIGQEVTLDLVAVYSYPAGGTAAAHIGLSTAPSLPGGNAVGIQGPNQISTVVSLLTGQAGRSFRGRMYLPGLDRNHQPSGLYALDYATAIANVMATKFTDGNAASGWGKAVVVSTSKTLHTQISAVSVDTRPDVQRRRANKTAGIQRAVSAVTL